VNAPLQPIRYLLLIGPAAAGLVLSEIPNYSEYAIAQLLLIWLAQLRGKLGEHPAQAIALWAEIVFAAWIAWTYGGLLYVLPFSTMMSVFTWTLPGGPWLPALALLAVLYGVTGELPMDVRLTLHALLIGWAVVLYAARDAASGRSRAEAHGDELRRKHYELEQARRTIAGYASEVERLAQAEERNRIARDIHDDLGHRLVRLKLMMDAAVAILPSDPEKGFGIVRQVRDQLVDGMETLRKTVRNMKPHEAELKYSLAALIEELGEADGIRIDFATEGMPYPLYPSEEIVLYRNAREAVTNAIRHGGADAFRIRLRYGERSVTMTVANNGSKPESIGRKGLGVSGMEERAKLLGGTIVFELEPEFAVTTEIPRQGRDAAVWSRTPDGSS
jgi:signal transduction histidine kinase